MLNQLHSQGKSIISRRWKINIRDIVNDYDFSLLNSHSNGGKCDFCGNNLTYVAVVEGKEINGNSNCRHEVGFDCLELVFGNTWKHYNQAMSSFKDMKKQAAIERRIEKNKIDFADIITWMKDRHPDFIKTNRFLNNMNQILETGEKPFTPSMESGVRRWMVGRTFSDKNEYDKRLKHFETVTIPKIEKVYHLVCNVDNIDHGTDPYTVRSSAYRFVLSVYQQALWEKRASPNQLSALENIFNRYVKIKNNMSNIDGGDANTIEKLLSEVPF